MLKNYKAEKMRLERELLRLKNELAQLESDRENFEVKFKKEMVITQGSMPCKCGVLPDGRIVVHVWVGGRDAEQLHIVAPEFYDENARVRMKYPGEQLGSPKHYQLPCLNL